MALVSISVGSLSRLREQATPNIQASTNSEAVVTGSELDARLWTLISYTLINADQTITYRVYGAHASDFSDEVVVAGPTDVLAGAVGSYVANPAPFSYYRVKIVDKVGGSHGNVRVTGVAK